MAVCRLDGHDRGDVGDDLPDVDRDFRQLELARVDLGQLEDRVDDLEQVPRRQLRLRRPRGEEVVVEAERLLRSCRRERPKILEIGTGSGCIAIALAKSFPSSEVWATDVSRAVLSLAARNARAHRVARRIRFIRQDLFDSVALPPGWADLVISNPPYIPSAEIEKLEPEVRREPRTALDGGPDGLAALRAIGEGSARWLAPGGFVVLEIGADQGEAVRGILVGAGLHRVEIRRDAQGLCRIASGVRLFRVG